MIKIIDKDNVYNKDILKPNQVLNLDRRNGNLIYSTNRYDYNKLINNNIQLDNIYFNIEINHNNKNIFNDNFSVLNLTATTYGNDGISNIKIPDYINKYFYLEFINYSNNIDELYNRFKEINSKIDIKINEKNSLVENYYINKLNPNDISNLMHWFDAQDDTTLAFDSNNYLSGWTDKIDNTYILSTTTASTSSNYIEKINYNNKQFLRYYNNLVQFYGLESNRNDKISDSEFTIFVVFRENIDIYYELVSKTYHGTDKYKVATDTTAFIAGGTSESLTVGYGTDTQLITLRYSDGRTFFSSKDHSEYLESTNTVSVSDDESNPLRILYNIGPFPYDIYIGDILIYNRQLTDDEVDSVKGYLMDKYNIYRKEMYIPVIKSYTKENYKTGIDGDYNVYNNLSSEHTNYINSKNDFYLYSNNSSSRYIMNGVLNDNNITFTIYYNSSVTFNDYFVLSVDKQEVNVSSNFELVVNVYQNSTIIDTNISLSQFNSNYLSANTISEFTLFPDENENYNIKFKDNCLYTNILTWLNNNGGYDSYNFELKRKDSVKIDKSGYYSDYNYNDTQIHTNDNHFSYNYSKYEIKNSFILSTNWLNYSEIEYLEDLFSSTEIYFYYENTWYSVYSLKNKNTIYNKQNKNKLKKYEFEIELSEKIKKI